MHLTRYVLRKHHVQGFLDYTSWLKWQRNWFFFYVLLNAVQFNVWMSVNTMQQSLSKARPQNLIGCIGAKDFLPNPKYRWMVHQNRHPLHHTVAMTMLPWRCCHDNVAPAKEGMERRWERERKENGGMGKL